MEWSGKASGVAVLYSLWRHRAGASPTPRPVQKSKLHKMFAIIIRKQSASLSKHQP